MLKNEDKELTSEEIVAQANQVDGSLDLNWHEDESCVPQISSGQNNDFGFLSETSATLYEL